MAVLAIPGIATPAALPPAPAIGAQASVLTDVLQGEFQWQAGASRQAALDYLQAAQASPDPEVAHRAASIALTAHEDALAERAVARWRQLDPDSPDLASVVAVLALRKGDRHGASRMLQAMTAAGGTGWKRALVVLATAPDSPTSALVAEDLRAGGHWPVRYDAWLALGDVVRRLGDVDLTRRVAGDIVRRFPQQPGAWLLEAARLQERGETQAARAAIEHALDLGHGDAKVREQVAAAYGRIGEPKRAATTLATGPQDVDRYRARAAWLAQADDAAALAALYAEVKAHTAIPDSTAGLLLGQLAEYLKRPDEALAWYRGVDDGPERAEARNRIAVVLADRGDLAGALAMLRATHADAADNPDAQADSYRIEADLLFKHGRKEEALATYDRGLAFFDGDPGLLYGRALLLEDMDRIAEAEADLRSIIAADPDNAEALNALGYTLADRTRRYAEAQVLIEKALRLRPDSPAFLDSLGWVQHRLGREVESLRNLRRAWALLKDPEIAAHLGEVLWLGGDKDEARAVWKEGLVLDKDNRALRRVVQTYHP